MVSVTDHGIGVPLERQAHVFEPLYEPLPTGHAGYVGNVSLGLYLTKLIVEAHGGRVWLDSTPGAGSTYSFGLPLTSASAHPFTVL